MNDRRPLGRHLDSRAALDYLETRMNAVGRRSVEEHLGHPCSHCRELVLELGWLIERMRRDRAVEIPDALRARALTAFEVPPTSEAPQGTTESLARLLLDSWSQPLQAAARRAAGEMRRLRFALGADVLELESEMESPDNRILRGRLHAHDPLLHRVEIVVGSEHLSTRPDASGAFMLDRLPAGHIQLTVTGPRDRFRLPPLE